MAKRFYTRYLGPSLKERFLEAAAQAEEKLELIEEIGVARALASEALLLLTACLDGKAKVDEETRALASRSALEAVEAVSRLVERAHKMAMVNKEFISVKQVDLVVAEICKLMHKVLGEEGIEKARLLEKQIREQVRLPEDPRMDPRVRIDVHMGYE